MERRQYIIFRIQPYFKFQKWLIYVSIPPCWACSSHQNEILSEIPSCILKAADNSIPQRENEMLHFLYQIALFSYLKVIFACFNWGLKQGSVLTTAVPICAWFHDPIEQECQTSRITLPSHDVSQYFSHSWSWGWCDLRVMHLVVMHSVRGPPVWYTCYRRS